MVSKYPGAGTKHVSIAFIAILLIVAVIVAKGRDTIFQKTGQFKITTETRSADSDDVNPVILRCPAIQAVIKGLDQNMSNHGRQTVQKPGKVFRGKMWICCWS